MVKKYIVRLRDEERATLGELLKKKGASSQKKRRAQVLLKELTTRQKGGWLVNRGVGG